MLSLEAWISIDAMQKVKRDNFYDLIKQANVEEHLLIETLVSALSHEEKSVVIGASLMLGRLRDERAVPWLLKRFLTNDQEIGSAVAWALGQCRSKAAVPFLTKAVEKGFAVANSCEALGNLEDEKALPILISVLCSDVEDVKMCAIKALGCLGRGCSPEQKDWILQELVSLARDPSRRVRICAGLVRDRLQQAR